MVRQNISRDKVGDLIGREGLNPILASTHREDFGGQGPVCACSAHNIKDGGKSIRTRQLDRSDGAARCGLAHIYLTSFTRAFAARDAALEEKLKSVSPRISGQTTMWSAGVGFHVSHALGVIFFGLVYGYLAPAERDFLIRAPFLGVLGRPRSARLWSPGEALLVLSAIG